MMEPWAERYVPPPVGSTWTQTVKLSGSMGKGTSTATIKQTGDRVWQGRKLLALDSSQGTTVLVEPESGGWVATVKGESPLIHFEPALAFRRPFVVGETWSVKERASGSLLKSPLDFVSTWKVEAQEDVTVRAGTCKAYRVRYTDTLGNDNLDWPCPELGIIVKWLRTRTNKHARGPGSSEMEVISHTIKR